MAEPVFDSLLARKSRGAFFTPPAIAECLADWAIADNPTARVLDPTCGDGVFLLAVGERLRELKGDSAGIKSQLIGVDIHADSLDQARRHLREDKLAATLIRSDFFDLNSPSQIGNETGWLDAVVGNPPFVRYQESSTEARKRAAVCALAQGVRLSGLASSWAPILVHASSFLKPDGRLAMVVPAEMLTVSYAEPIRRWLLNRFESVHLVLFEELQFEDAEEQVVLLIAEGTGTCDSFTLWPVRDAEHLSRRRLFDGKSAAVTNDGKWTDLMLPLSTRQLFRHLASTKFTRLDTYGTPELGTVTGNNEFFAVNDAIRRKYNLTDGMLKRICPPGTRHIKGVTFTHAHWEELRLRGERVWLLHPDPKSRAKGLASYIKFGEKQKVHLAYKCTIRDPWWRPPVVPAPDLYFTYMSHRYPRLISNTSGSTLVNSMHGVRLKSDAPECAREALSLLSLNSLTMLGAEIQGRSYGGGILKMEPREAAGLPVPTPDVLGAAWKKVGDRRASLEDALKRGEWASVVDAMDDALLRGVMRMPEDAIGTLRDATKRMRVRRTRQTEADASA